MNQRGQTAYDYLLGIVVLLVTIITVLSLFPQVFGPFVESASADREKMADRVASDVIEESALNGSERTVNLSKLDDDAYIERVKAETGIRDIQSVNVTVQRGPKMVEQAGDERLGNEPSATVVRSVRTASGTCKEGCQLIVRVW